MRSLYIHLITLCTLVTSCILSNPVAAEFPNNFFPNKVKAKLSNNFHPELKKRQCSNFLPKKPKSSKSKRRHQNKHSQDKSIRFKHKIQLQLRDSLGFPVNGTEFWVTLNIVKQGPVITIHFPVINFQTGQISPLAPPLPALVPGGYLYTSDGFLPKEIRPNDLVNFSVVAASNNGTTETFSLAQDPATLPKPPAGYILQVTNSGAVVVQAAGEFGNIIPPGHQILMPTALSYIINPKEKLCKNFKISKGAVNTTEFTNPGPANDGIRDSHPNDAYQGVVAYAWTDNSTVQDKTNGTLNLMVAVGNTDASGRLIMGKPVQLTNFPPNVLAWDTAVAINRHDPQNIVVSYGLIDNSNFAAFPPCRAVSFDGGKTWPAAYEYIAVVGSISGTTLTVTEVIHGTLAPDQTIFGAVIPFPKTPVAHNTTIVAQLSGTLGGVGTYSLSGPSQNVQTTVLIASPPLNGPLDIIPQYADGFGDNRGVIADKFGNFWYSTTIFFDDKFHVFNGPTFAYSTDGGVTFRTYPQDLLNIPPFANPAIESWDYTQICLGVDENHNYGMYFEANHSNNVTFDTFPTVWFLPITNPITFNPAEVAPLPQFMNAMAGASLTASSDGRLWLQGISYPFLAQSFIEPTSILFKSPGPLDANYAGPWNHDIARIISPYTGHGYPTSGLDSQPVVGIFLHSIQSIIYDDKRQAFYALLAFQTPDDSQNMRLVFIISRDNTQTWSNPIDISTTKFANRGFATMALDEATGNLNFGWYDGRNDKTFKSLEYFGAVIPAKKLDKLVKKIPLSNPLFIVPPAASSTQQQKTSLQLGKKKMDTIQNRFKTRLDHFKLAI